MPAINQQQVENQITAYKDFALRLVKAFAVGESVIEQDDVVGQNWNTLASDWPDIVDGDNTILLGGQRQVFSVSSVQQSEVSIRALLDVFLGNTVDASILAPTDKCVKIIGNPSKRIRALLETGLII